MRSIVHTQHGDPDQVLSVAKVAPPTPGPGQVLVRVLRTPVHFGDLLGVSASPAFGSPPAIGPTGRTPGFEGAGVIEALGEGVQLAPGLAVGSNVAFFPVSGAWSELIAVPVTSLVALPDGVSLNVAAMALVNTITASLILRAGHAAVPEGQHDDVTVIQTGAGSAVGRLITVLLAERGVKSLRLVRTAESAGKLAKSLPGGPVFATELPDWVTKVREATQGKPIHVALDGVGGKTLPGLAAILADGGTVISYGSLGGGDTDIRLLSARALTLRGLSIGRWGREAEAVRQADIATALRLAQTQSDLFDTAGVYAPEQIGEAVAHVARPGKTGTVLLSF
uniref:Alcohol dehydrogenase GroES domain protein n=1 Tax=Caulobacter sp. (strain K31) TaxID=366602 RepID=B0T960_CAUSK